MNDRLLGVVEGLNNRITNVEERMRDNEKDFDHYKEKNNEVYMAEIAKKLDHYNIKDGMWYFDNYNTGVPAQGPKGEAFTYEDFTPEQLEKLRGPKGEPFTFDDLTTEQIVMLTGADGLDGADGKDGKDGYTPVKGKDYFDGKDGKDGKDAPLPNIKIGEVKAVSTFDKAGATITRDGEDFVLNLDVPRGRPGSNGSNGSDGSNGAPGRKGDKGDPGDDGRGIVSVEKTGTSGNVDTYTITYTDDTTSTYDVYNGEVSEQEFQADQQRQDKELDYYKTLYNAMPKVTGTGTEPTIDDTVETMLKMDLSGNTYQESTTGANLYDYTDLKETYNFLTYDGDGWYTAACDNTNGSSTVYFNFTTKFSNLLETDTSYSIVTEIKNANVTGTSKLNSWDRWGQFSVGSTGYSSAGTYVGTSTTKSDFTNVTQMLASSVSCAAGSKSTFTFRISVIKGTSVTTDNFVYEPYTGGQASPNPDYPQDIEVVTGDNEIKIIGKNLLPNNATTQTISGVTFTKNEDGTIKANGTATATTDLYLVGDASNYVNLGLQTGTYTLSGCTTGSGTTYMLYLVKNSGGALSYHQNQNSPINISVTRGDTFRIFVRVLNGQAINTTIYPMLELGSTATDYMEHKEQTYPVNLEDIELCKIGNYKDSIIYQNNKWYKHAEIGKVVLDGSEDWLSHPYGTNSYSLQNVINVSFDNLLIQTISNYFKGVSYSNRTIGSNIIYTLSDVEFVIRDTVFTSLSNFKTWLGNHNTTVYYVLATPTNTEITDTTLIEQLNDLKYVLAYKDQTNISQTNDEQPFIIDYETLYDMQNLVGA